MGSSSIYDKSHLTWDLAQGQVGIQPVIVTWEASACWQRKGQPWEPTWTQSRTRGAGEGAGWPSTQRPRQGGSGRAPWRSHPRSDRGLCPREAVLWVEQEYNARDLQTHSPRIGKQHHVGESRVILSANAVVCGGGFVVFFHIALSPKYHALDHSSQPSTPDLKKERLQEQTIKAFLHSPCQA